MSIDLDKGLAVFGDAAGTVHFYRIKSVGLIKQMPPQFAGSISIAKSAIGSMFVDFSLGRLYASGFDDDQLVAVKFEADEEVKLDH